jgi:Flp pilus assembly protein TadD
VVCLLLVAVTLLCYWPSIHHQLVLLDDYHYLLENPDIQSGLSWSSLAWAFKTGYFCNWHPITYITYIVDWQLNGSNPLGYHVTNLIFHLADTVLLFLLFQRMTGRLWPSAFVAALFAWHPLHVESVAWVSERKDVLSAFFWILAMMAYVRYVEFIRADGPSQGGEEGVPELEMPNLGRRRGYYALALLCFALGLMSKPMVVTLPCVLMLMDYWPLRRFSISPPPRPAQLLGLIMEKLPFFSLALAASVVTYIVQKAGGAVASLDATPFSARLPNAALAYLRYMGKAIWPAHLSVMYPYPSHLTIGIGICAALVLSIISGFFLWRAKQQPFLIVGWLWFVGTLVPVIGLVQVGAQSMADRYTYIPSIGLFALLVWGAESLCNALANRREILIGLGSASLAGCLACTSVQLSYWQNSEKLFRHAVTLDPDNYLAYDGLGKALEDQGKKEEALKLYALSVRHPQYSQGHYNYGTLLLQLGRLHEAVVQLTAALASNPHYAQAHNNLSTAYINLGDLEQARVHLGIVADLKPHDPQAHNNLASVLLMQSRLDEAAVQLSAALRLNPDFAEAHRNLGVALVRQGKLEDAITHFSRAVQLTPTNAEMHFNLGLARMDLNQPAEAAAQFIEASRLSPNDARFHYRLAIALARQQRSKEAISQYRQTLMLSPDFPEALNELAHYLAADPNPELRAGIEAVKLAEKACTLAEPKKPEMLATLAAAYAEVGRFPEAVATAQKARELALGTGQQATAAQAEEMTKLYLAERPFRDTY